MITAAGRLLGRADRAADGLAADLALYGCAAAFAAVTAATSTLLPHRAWGAIAAWGYLAAFLITGGWLLLRRTAHGWLTPGPRARAGLTLLTWVSTALLPLLTQAAQRAAGQLDRAQEEVIVVEHAGARLLDAGTPYLGRDAIAALPAGEQLLGYLPYQPAMAIFGLPRAAIGVAWWTDARVWFACATAAALGAAIAVLWGARQGHLIRAVQFATVLPICALTLATGGDDLPVLALCLLALACCATERYGAAGLAIGSAAALKLFALPVLAVLVVLVVAAGHGRRLLVGALAVPAVVLVPALLVDGDALLENVVRFPLGEGLVRSPAQSPLPGYLISVTFPAGRYVATALLVSAALVITVWLLRRPPRTARCAALVSGYGLLTAILLMPTTRFGYLLYPLALVAWAPALGTPRPLTARSLRPGVRPPAPLA